MGTFSAYCIQLTLVPDNQYGVITAIMIFDLNRKSLIILNIITLAYFNLDNLFHLPLRVISFPDLFAQGTDFLIVVGHEVFFGVKHREGSNGQAY